MVEIVAGKHTLRKSDAITLTAEATYTGMNLSMPKKVSKS